MADYVARSAPQPPPTLPPAAFLLEMHWTDANFHDKVCRVHNACLRRDGALLVHPWMRSQEPHLRECGIPHLEYMSAPAEFAAHHPSAALDLFGAAPTRYHIPHFLTDILPMVYARELLRPVFTPPHLVKSVCEAPRRRRCERHAIQETLRPSLYTDKRVARMQLSDWVPQLSALIFDRPHMHFAEDMFANTSKVCFRSVITYNRHNFFRRGPQWFGDENPLFAKHGLTRGSVAGASHRPENLREKGCRKRLTVLNRVGWTKRGNILTGRDIVNVGQVVQQAEARARGLKHRNLDLTISVEYFENKTFPEQVDVMQKADVLLGVHGAGLGNMLFARQDVPILEVQPFAYYAGPFDALARALYLDYSKTIAEPDTDNFRECLQVYADKAGDPGLVKTGMDMWNDAVAHWRQGDKYKLQAQRITDRKLVPVKLCARSQRMRVDAADVARRLVEMAQKLCGADVEAQT